MSVRGAVLMAQFFFARGATTMVDWLDLFGVFPINWEMTGQLDDKWVPRLPGQRQ
jgi:hypothetical protein